MLKSFSDTPSQAYPMSSPIYKVFGVPGSFGLSIGYTSNQRPSTLLGLIFCIKKEFSFSPTFLIIFSPLGTGVGVGDGLGVELGFGVGEGVGIGVSEGVGVGIGLGEVVCLVETK